MEGIRRQKRGGKRVLILSCLLIIPVLVQIGLMIDVHTKSVSAATISKPDSATRARIEENFGKLPLYFIENRGQMDSRVTYYVKGRDKALFFTSQGVTFILRGNGEAPSSGGTSIQTASYTPSTGKPRVGPSLKRWVVSLDFVGGNPQVKPVGVDPTEMIFSYFKGPREQWKTGLKTYASVVYRDLWPGIDLIYMGTVNQLKYRFVVKPGADPNMIRLVYRGADSVMVSDAGRLEVKTPAGGFRDDRPHTYQEVKGQRVEVATSYTLVPDGVEGAEVYGFRLGYYDKTRPLVLDPAVLVYCGFLGGGGVDSRGGIAVDGSGNAYVTGYTESTGATFPVTVGPDLIYNDWGDAFVAKLNPSGTGLLYCGYIGGSGTDSGGGIAVDGSGNAYVTGYTGSTEATFPVTVGPDLIYNGGWDAFMAKVNPSGTGLLYCGYIGGNSADYGNSIAVDGSGNAYVTGYCASTEATFPVTVGPDLTHNGGTWEAFVAKVSSLGTSLHYCGYIGGSSYDYGNGIAVDGSGNAYVTGNTASDEATFPVTMGPDLTHNGGSDTFVAKVNSSGTSLHYCGYIGGSSNEYGLSIGVDSSGNAYVTGNTGSDEGSFPVTTGPDLTYNGGTCDAFVTKVNSSGTSLLYCGYIGGSNRDYGCGTAADGDGNAYVGGYTWSTEAEGFPVMVGPDLTYNGGDFDAFTAKVNSSGTSLLYCGYIGGSGYDQVNGIAVDGSGNAYVIGGTGSTEVTFPVMVGPDLSYNGLGDAFMAKISTQAGRDELAVDFSTNGLWHYDGSTWSNLAGWDPSGMEEWTGGLAVDFGASYGLWNYDGTSWASLAGWNPADMEAYGTGLAVDFDIYGLWYYNGTGWTSLAGWNPDGNMVAWTGGLAVDFGVSYGLWNYDGSSWTSLAGWDPGGMEVYGTGLAVDFNTYGLWHYNGSTWTSLAGWDPEGIEIWGSDLAVDFGTYGLWNYDGSSWTSLAGWNPDVMEAYGAGLSVDFGTYGIWYYDGSTWTSLAGWDPEDMVAWANGLAADFGASYGLWNYDGSSWSSLAGWDPEDMIDVDLY